MSGSFLMNSKNKTWAFTVAVLILNFSLTGCATSDGGSDLQKRQTVECPDSLMLICEGRGEPSSGGDEEIPQYDRCYCRPRPN